MNYLVNFQPLQLAFSGQFSTGVNSVEHFSDENGRCMLNKAGRQHFYTFYESHCRGLRRLLRRYGYALSKRYLLIHEGA